MKVKRICSRNLVCARRSFSLQEAAVLMREHHVGALLVTEEGPREDEFIGIVTDRDLVLQALAEGIGPREATVGDVMMPVIATIPENAEVFEALETMRDGGIRRLAVSADEGVLVGIISLDDILDALGAELTSLGAVIRSERERESAVEA